MTRRFADRLRPFGLVRHRGRVTGGRYETPVMAYATPGGLAIALVYGRDADWVRNVIAAAEVQIERRSEARTYAHARLATRDEALGLLPASVRPFLRAVRVRDFLLVSASDRSAEAATASKEARR